MENGKDTLVVWHRLGKEHGEHKGFRKNPAAMIEKHLSEKANLFRRVPMDDWRWWQINDELIVEKPLPQSGFSDRAIVYYLLKKGCAIIEDFSPRIPDRWFWYIHIASYKYESNMRFWIMVDMFADIVVGRDRSDHAVLDLDELANASRIGLITRNEMYSALESCQELLDQIRKEQFPPKVIEQSYGFLKSRHWR